MRAFWMSILWGTVAGSALPLLLSSFIAIVSIPVAWNGGVTLFDLIRLALLPAFVTASVVVGASLLFGLPLTMILARLRREGRHAYTISGALLGALIPVIMLLAIDADASVGLSILGAISGAVTGRSWWIEGRSRIAADPLCNPR